MSLNEQLWEACSNGNLDAVKTLVANPAVNINYQDPTYSRSPFYRACGFGGHLRIVEFLSKDPRIDMNLPNIDGASPLYIACDQKHLDVIRFLLNDPRVKVNQATNDKATALFLAAQKGESDVVELLLASKKADLSLSNEDAWTPLFVGWIFAKTKVLDIICKYRASLGIKPEAEVDELIKMLHPADVKLIEVLPKINDILVDPRTRPALLASPFFSLFITKCINRATASELSMLVKSFRYISKLDEVRKAFSKQHGYTAFANRFMATPSADLVNRIVDWRVLFDKGREIREDFVMKGPEFLAALARLAEGNPNDWVKVEAAGCILTLIGHHPHEHALNVARDVLFAHAAGGSEQRRALDCFMRASSLDTSRSILLNLGVKELVDPLMEDPDSPFAFVACLIQALLAASDVGANGQGGQPTNRISIDRVFKALAEYADSDIFELTTTEGYYVELSQLLIAVRSLATNEANLIYLREKDIVATLKKLVQNRRNLFEDDIANVEEVSNVVWVLSFDQESRKELKDAGFVALLKSFHRGAEGEGVKRALSGALWNLEGEETKVKEINSQAQKQQQHGHIMISYSWHQKERMRELAAHLKSLDLPVWVDVEQMEGSILEKMSEAIEEAGVVIIGLSATYKESQACRTEAEYAYRLKKEVIFVMAEDGYSPRGWLGAMVGTKLYYDPWGGGGIESGASEIVKLIRKTIGEVKEPAIKAAGGSSGAPPTPSPPSSSNFVPFKTHRDYSHVKQPENLNPLSIELLSPSEMKNWGVEEVACWLKMAGLERLIAPFIVHEITGRILLEWRGLQVAEFIRVWEMLDLHEVGLFLSFQKALDDFFDIKNWTNLHVVSWLQNRNLPPVATVAEKEGWDGWALYGLHKIHASPSFDVHCKDLGISKTDQFRLLSRLGELFRD